MISEYLFGSKFEDCFPRDWSLYIWYLWGLGSTTWASVVFGFLLRFLASSFLLSLAFLLSSISLLMTSFWFSFCSTGTLSVWGRIGAFSGGAVGGSPFCLLRTLSLLSRFLHFSGLSSRLLRWELYAMLKKGSYLLSVIDVIFFKVFFVAFIFLLNLIVSFVLARRKILFK